MGVRGNAGQQRAPAVGCGLRGAAGVGERRCGADFAASTEREVPIAGQEPGSWRGRGLISGHKPREPADVLRIETEVVNIRKDKVDPRAARPDERSAAGDDLLLVDLEARDHMALDEGKQAASVRPARRRGAEAKVAACQALGRDANCQRVAVGLLDHEDLARDREAADLRPLAVGLVGVRGEQGAGVPRREAERRGRQEASLLVRGGGGLRQRGAALSSVGTR